MENKIKHTYTINLFVISEGVAKDVDDNGRDTLDQMNEKMKIFVSRSESYYSTYKYSYVFWNKNIHKCVPNSTKKTLETILILNLKDEQTREPKYNETYFYQLPKEIILEVFNHIKIDVDLQFI